MEAGLIFKNTVALSVATVLARAISAIVGIFVARYLGPTASGEYAIALSFVSTILLVTDFGMGQLMVQEGSRDQGKLSVYLGNTLISRLLLIAIVDVGMVIAAKPLGYNLNIRTMILIFAVANGFGALDNMMYNYFQARQEMYIAAIYQFLSTLFIGIGTILVLVEHWGVIQIALVQLVVIMTITYFLYKSITRKTKLQIDWRNMLPMFKAALPFGIAYLLYSVYFQISSFMLSLMGTSTQVGNFAAAYRLISVLLFIPSVVTSVIYPMLYQLGDSNRDEHKKTIEVFFKFSAAVGLPVSMTFFLLANQIIHFLYGSAYSMAAPALKILAWIFALDAMSFAIGDILTTTDNQWTRTIIQGIATVINIVLSYFLIHSYSLYGASAVMLIVEVFIFLAYLFAARKKVYDINIVKQLPGVVIAILGLSGAEIILNRFNPVIVAGIGGIVYFVVLDRVDRDFHKVIRYILKRIKIPKLS